jgi:hypothetical protein
MATQDEQPIQVPEGFDPKADWSETPPELMTLEERRVAALATHYELTRHMVALEELSTYAAQLAGAGEDEIEAVAQLAERDELEAAEAGGEDPE